jgi:outer membrane protein assembly factor BamB
VIVGILCLSMFSFLHVASTGSEVTPNDWPMFHRDLCRTGFLNASSSKHLPYVRLLWNCDIPGGGVCGSHEISDLNGDGKVEIVVGAQDGVFCFSNTGVLLWNYSTGNDVNLPTVADLYSDGKEMVLVSSNNGMVYCLNGTDGKLIWNSTCTGNPGWLDAPTVADINNDGKMEVIAITGYANCFDRDGSKIWDYVYPGGGFGTQPAIADINNDDKPELVFNHQGYLCVMTGDGKLLMYNESGGYGSECSPVIADINNDGALEIILANYGGVYAFNSSGGLLWGKMIGTYIFACPAIADVNNDGEMEIVVAKPFGTVCLLDRNGNQLWRYQAKRGGRDQSPVIADIDGDGKPEIIIGPVDGMIYCLNCEGRELWNYYVGSDAALSPAIADVNGDGVLDIVTTSGSGLFVLTPSAQPNALSASISPNSALIPIGNSSKFSSIVSGGLPPYTYQWCLNGTPVSGATTNSWTFTPTSSGSFTVYLNVTDRAGIILISDNAMVDVSAEDNYVFLVSSNSTLSGLAFNATGKVLSFTASGPSGTTGYAQITLSKSIVADPTGIAVSVDNSSVSYTITSLDDSWLLTLNYTHSTHRVAVDLKVIRGDINRDFKVTLADLVLLALAYGCKPGDAKWNPTADIDGNGIVGLSDLVILAQNYGKTA